MGPPSRLLQPAAILAVLVTLLLVLSCACTAPAPTATPAPVLVQPPTPPVEFPVSPEILIPPTVPGTPAVSMDAVKVQAPATVRTFTFLSGKDTWTISVPVRESQTSSASDGGGEDCPLARWHAGSEREVSSYYLQRIFSAEQEELYTAILGELSRIRRMEGLNDDEYLELITNFIQQIPYDPAAPLCPRTPTAVILDGKGDCDEKSGLLLGLLSREQYDVALLLFAEQQHATAGIRITSPTTPSFRVFGERGRNYVYVETTGPSLIGLYGSSFATASPVVIRVGNGTLQYRAINDVMYVVGVQKRMEERMTFLWETREDHLREINRLEVLLSNQSYDTEAEFDADSARYLRLIAEYNQMGTDFTAIHQVYQFLVDHQYDRAGCRARIENSKVELLL